MCIRWVTVFLFSYVLTLNHFFHFPLMTFYLTSTVSPSSLTFQPHPDYGASFPRHQSKAFTCSCVTFATRIFFTSTAKDNDLLAFCKRDHWSPLNSCEVYLSCIRFHSLKLKLNYSDLLSEYNSSIYIVNVYQSTNTLSVFLMLMCLKG